ncbi:hypothetical protein PVK06_048564 [Gossypium arboreum]|uniref:Uncharacterized protein n=1 Tax=Gossypium arboreum TaxID=29729 RepID=A0ABR0MGT7_GOSAR|nr:hypothetical protein PVK06_048564 [Gossypium arboreum]
MAGGKTSSPPPPPPPKIELNSPFFLSPQDRLGKAPEKRSEHDRLHQFLLGLYSDYYAQIRSTLLYQDLLPFLNRAF